MSNIKEAVINEIHKPARKNFRRRHVLIKGLNDLLQIDLVEMIPYAKMNKGYRYILIAINTFSKYVWAEPVKRKTAKDVTTAMKKILESMKIKPKNVQSDQGLEFFNKEFRNLMQFYNINHYNTFSSMKASIVERVNRTLKGLMWKQFSLRGNYKWIDILQDIVAKYNNTVHRTIKLRPNQVTKRNAKQLLQTVYSRIKIIDPKKPKFKTGDHVRISKHREAFTKGYKPNWSNEIFVINKVNRTNPITYLLKDTSNEEIQGMFYPEELQLTSQPNIYLVERIIRKKGNKLFVKWLGMDKKFNTWINKNEIV